MSLLLCVATGQPATAGADDLPDIGSGANSIITTDQEYQVGRVVVKGLRSAGRILEDPMLTDYIEEVGHRIVLHANDGDHKFNFFVVKDNAINAFALPGGFIGINAGLLLQTANESELAGVISHEIAHVTQRHIARRVQADSKTSLVSTAALIAGLIIAATSGAGADVTQAIIAATQGFSAQAQINHTRANEYEADRVGIKFLAASDFDPNAMAAFFGTMSRLAGLGGSWVPEYLRTHPMESSRIAEAANRAATYPPVQVSSSDGYMFMRERLRVLMAQTPEEALRYYQDYTRNLPAPYEAHVRYGYALALLKRHQAVDALGMFKKLLDERPDVIAFHVGYAEALIGTGNMSAGLAAFEEAHRLFPRNVPVTIAFSETLMEAGNPARAHQILLDLLNNIAPTAEQARLIALAASAEGDMANAHYYMSEFHIINGELPLAVDQLKLALAQPELQIVQRARFQARLEEIQQYLPENSRPQ